MNRYEIVISAVKYILCLILIINLVKSKESDTLIKAIVTSFIVVSIASFTNLILQLTTSFNTGRLFISFNFLDYLNITLILNILLKKRKRKMLL